MQRLYVQPALQATARAWPLPPAPVPGTWPLAPGWGTFHGRTACSLSPRGWQVSARIFHPTTNRFWSNQMESEFRVLDARERGLIEKLLEVDFQGRGELRA